jgi:hypothetical protein
LLTMTRTGTLLAIHGVLTAALAVSALASGCGSSAGSSSPDGGDGNGVEGVLNPEASDFSDFTGWKHQFHLKATSMNSFPLSPDGSALADPVHANGNRDIYINLGEPGAPACVPQGAKEFPVGTIIVKVLAQPNLAVPGTNQAVPGVFAAVKVATNDAYNAAGAAGWEWFDLITPLNGLDGGDAIVISWEGATAPTSSAYGGDPEVCNNCHTAMGSANDSIISPVLQLEDFECKP